MLIESFEGRGMLLFENQDEGERKLGDEYFNDWYFDINIFVCPPHSFYSSALDV